jgi:hypothetical protein
MSNVDPGVAAYGPLPKGAAYWGLDPNSGNPVPYSASGQPVPTQQQEQKAEQQRTKGQQQQTQKAQAQKIEGIKKQINDLLTGSGGAALVGAAQVQGAGAGALAQKVGALLAQLPYADYNQMIAAHQNVLKGTPLGTAVTNAVQAAGAPGGAAAKPAAPSYDPLALQTMWSSVFGPAFKQASQIAGTAGTGYLAGMNQAIAGAHQSPQAAQQLQGQSQAMANLLQQFGRTSAQNVPAGLTIDSIVNALAQASGAAQQAYGEAEKQVGYQQAIPYVGGSTTGGTTPTNQLNAALAGGGATAAQQIGANQTAPSLYPHIP